MRSLRHSKRANSGGQTVRRPGGWSLGPATVLAAYPPTGAWVAVAVVQLVEGAAGEAAASSAGRVPPCDETSWCPASGARPVGPLLGRRCSQSYAEASLSKVHTTGASILSTKPSVVRREANFWGSTQAKTCKPAACRYWPASPDSAPRAASWCA